MKEFLVCGSASLEKQLKENITLKMLKQAMFLSAGVSEACNIVMDVEQIMREGSLFISLGCVPAGNIHVLIILKQNTIPGKKRMIMR